MARISRTGTTDSTGVASTTVAGTGGGRLKFISRNGGLWSNSKEILDAIFVDSSDCTVHPYNNNTTAEWIDNYWKVTMQSTSTYFDIIHTDRGVYRDYVPLNTVKGQTVTVEFDYKTTSNQVRSIAYYDDGTGWRQLESAIDLEDTNDEWVHFKRSYTFSSEATRVWVRLQNKGSVALTFSIKDLIVYPIFSAPKHYTPIALSSSASIIQTGETATLTAELTNVLGEKLAQKSVNFIEKSAQVGTDNWRTSSTITPTTIDDYTVLSATNPSAFASIALDLATNSNAIEFDVNINVSIAFMSLRKGTTIVTNLSNEYLEISSSLNEWHHIKIEWNDTQYRAIVDGDIKNYRTFSDTPNRWQFSINANTGLEIKYKNFKVIGDKTVTETTNSQGVASTTITSNQTGERQFIAKADNTESETTTITDNGYIYSHEEEITSNTSTDNYKVITTLSELPSQFELTFDYKTNTEARVGLFSSNNFSGNPNYSVFVGSPNGSSSKYYGVRTTTTNTSDVNGSPTDYHSYLIRRDGDTFYFQIDGGTVYSKSANWFDNYTYVLGLMGWGTDKTSSVKNIILRSI